MSDDQYKPHSPTPQTLKKRRDEGKSPRGSAIVPVFMCVGCAFLCIQFAMLNWSGASNLLIAVASGASINDVMSNIWLIIFSVGAVFCVISTISPRIFGPVIFNAENLAFKISRISIFKNASNKFGLQGLVDFGVKAVFMAITAAVGYLFLSIRNYDVHLYTMSSRSIIVEGVREFQTFFLILAFIFAVFTFAEYLQKYVFFIRDNKMSHQQLKEEIEGDEGKAEVKQERRRRAIELGKSIGLENVAEADVIMVNPTHYAVGFKWERGTGRVPQCVCRGGDEMAFAIRKLAREHKVPIYEDPPNARRLYRDIAVGDFIEQDHFKCVAAAIAFADRVRQKVTS